jgi:hypothetical protein
MIEQKHLDLLQELKTGKSSHSGRTLWEHLKGTYELLESWENPKHVCIGGLFHSIYGTQYYKVQSANLEDRRHIADIISPQAEELAYLFCTTDRAGFFTEADQLRPLLVDATTQNLVSISTTTLGALIEIEVANCMEQTKSDTASAKRIDRMRLMLDRGKKHLSVKAQDELTCFLGYFK